MYTPITTHQFRKDYKRLKKSGQHDMYKLETVMKNLVMGIALEQRFWDHQLIGNFSGRKECHIEPDWLLIYRYDINEIIFERTGSHTDLFE